MYFTKFGPCDEYQKDAYFKRRTETTTSRRRSGHMCRRKVRWRSSFPLRGPLPLIRPRTAIPFDRHMCPELHAPRGYIIGLVTICLPRVTIPCTRKRFRWYKVHLKTDFVPPKTFPRYIIPTTTKISTTKNT